MIEALLKKAIEADKLSHAYILTGGRQSDRQRVAEEFALDILDERDREGHPDLIHIVHEKPATIGIDDIRQQLIDDAQIRPFRCRYKVYIMDEAEKMNAKAQNAILKTIEEPPEYVIIILLTGNEQMLLETIRSRCINLQLDASDYIDKDSEEYKKYISILKGEAEPAFADAQETERFLEAARDYFRDVLVSKKTARFDATRYSFEQLGKILDAIDEAETRIKFNVNPELSIKLMMMEIIK